MLDTRRENSSKIKTKYKLCKNEKKSSAISWTGKPVLRINLK